MLMAVPLNRDEANALVKRWHRHHKPVRSHRFAIGATLEGTVRGGVIVGNPVAASFARQPIAEVTRLVTDGTPHVASFLLGAARRAALAMGYRRLISYIRADEIGTCYRAAGWRRVALVDGRQWAGVNKPGRWLPGIYEPMTEIIDRVRWETGPDALAEMEP